MGMVLAIDQGTTSTRAFAVDNSGSGQIVHSIRHKQYYPHSGWVEHDPLELVASIQECVDSCPDVDLVGIDNQGESCLGWNSETKEPISPVIVWQDARTASTVDHLKTEGAEEAVRASTGLPLDPYFSASKLGWIFENIPEARDLHRQGRLRLGTTDAFFLDRLTGNCVTDVSTASRTSLMNIRTCQWDPSICQLFNVPPETLPEIVPTVGDFGSIVSKGRQLPVTANVVDQQASLYGHNCLESGSVKITFGTGAFALAVTRNLVTESENDGLLPTVAWQHKGADPVYALEGGVYCAGSAVNWARSMGLFADFDQINYFSKPSAIERGLAFVPALAGLGCPHWDRSAAGLWIGLSLDTCPEDAIQSILEGVAFRAKEVIEAMSSQVSLQGAVSIDGGLSVNPYFCQFLADVLQRKVVVQESGELTAMGTARLAAGNRFDSHARPAAAKEFVPATNRDDEFMLFKDAVSRSLNWRR